MLKKALIFLSFICISFTQQHLHDHDGWIRCAAEELEQELQLTNPEFIKQRDAQISKSKQLLNQNPQWALGKNSQELIYIPVIFHVLYFSQSDNISAELIGANFDQINLDFQNLNPDGDEIPSAPNPSDVPYDKGIDYSHQSVRGSHNIQFVGAQGELSGDFLVEGSTIKRYQISQSTVENVSEASTLALNTPTDSGTESGYKEGYMNIYIAPLTGGLLGQAYLGFPEAVVLGGSVGSVEKPGTAGNYSRGRTLTHELGHNFTYNHVFNSSTCGQVIWNDIPSQTANNRGASIYEWPVGSGNFYGRDGVNSCISSTGKGDQFMNYMDYVYDDQMRMFSEEQAVDGYAWASSRNWAQVVDGVSTVITSNVSYGTSNDGFTIDIAFSEEVEGFIQNDIVLTNGVISNFNSGDGTNFSFDVEAVVDGEVKVFIPQSSCTGISSGDPNFSSNELSIIVDRVSPQVGNLEISNIKDSQYITQNASLNLKLNDFIDETSGIGIYYVSIGLSPNGQEVLSPTAFVNSFPNSQADYFINIDNTGYNFTLDDYQQYFVNVYSQDLVGLNSEVVSKSFYFFGSLIGDSNNDWIIDFSDYSYFISNYPGIDIAPVTGSAPYFFPNFDGVSDSNDLAMFEAMWNWSIDNNGRTIPNYTIQGKSPDIRILNNKMLISFAENPSSAQLYFEYDIEKYKIDFVQSDLNNNFILDGNDSEEGIIQIEYGNIRSQDQSAPIQLLFSFQSLVDSYEFMRVSYSSYNNSNQVVSEGYDLIQTAPSSYNLSQSFPNPFTANEQTNINFDLPASQNITLVILDIRGRVVRKLIDGEERFGYQSVAWDAKNDSGDIVSNGVYFYQISSKNFNDVGKLVFVK
jgi:hypothetical protein